MEPHSAPHSPANPPLPRRKRGRPKGGEAQQAILRAAHELLLERGIAGFTIEAVAARAGAAKTTIYRWWPSKGALAVAGLLAATEPAIAYPQTASAAADLRAQMHRLARVYAGPVGRAMAGIIAEGQSDPAATEALVKGFIRPRRAATRAVLERGVASGELRPGLDPEAAIDALYGPIFYRLLVRHGSLEPAWVDRLADAVLDGLRSHDARCSESK